MLVHELSSEPLFSLRREDPAILVWWTAEVECVSAIARLERESSSVWPIDDALQRLDSLAAAWDEVHPGERIRRTARRLLRVHPLRAADALQLGAALVGADNHPESLDFVTLDTRLADAARREGFQVLDLRPT